MIKGRIEGGKGERLWRSSISQTCNVLSFTSLTAMLSRKYLVFWVFVAAFFGIIFIMLNLKATALIPVQTNSLAAVCPSVTGPVYPTNSRFMVTKRSGAYEANSDPSCWLQDCKMRNNHRAFRTCSSDVASDWNALGVLSMERYLNGDLTALPDYNKKSLMDAIWYFRNATTVQTDCGVAQLNLGIALLQAEQYDASVTALEKVRPYPSILRSNKRARAGTSLEKRRQTRVPSPQFWPLAFI